MRLIVISSLYTSIEKINYVKICKKQNVFDIPTLFPFCLVSKLGVNYNS